MQASNPSSSSLIRESSGCVPSVLDPTQTSRLLKVAGSTLAFASFDPQTASATHHLSDFRKPSLNDQLYRQKRVVIETLPSGECFWRFVPKARCEDGVDDEGTWPRIVDICGELVNCSREQWEIYKLDPAYDCLVRKSPLSPVITRSERHQTTKFDFAPPATPPPDSAFENLKRRQSASPKFASNGTESTQKRFRIVSLSDHSSEEDDDDDDDEEVEEMVIDSVGRTKLHLQSERLKKVRANIEEARRRRREWNSNWKSKKMATEDAKMECPETPKSIPHREPERDLETAPTAKRKVQFDYHEDRTVDKDSEDEDDVDYMHKTPGKRTRRLSPNAAKRSMAEKRAERSIRRKEEMDRRLQERAEAKWKVMMDGIFADLPPSKPEANETAKSEDTNLKNGTDPIKTDDEATRQAAIKESRRKLAALEADRPLWEEHARQRRVQDEEERRAAEAMRSKRTVHEGAEAQQRMARERTAEDANRRVEEEIRQKRAEAQRKREFARQQAVHERKRWEKAKWTVPLALERYQQLSEKFDKASFHSGDVLVFETVPWPVLIRPGTFGVEDIDWSAVEKFFAQIRPFMSLLDHKSLIEKSHKRFHPDRWRSRRVLQNVEDEEERECLEVAANTVAQALTPLWKEATGRH